MNKFIKAFDKLSDAIQAVLVVVLLACCSFVFLSVILRYCFNLSFQWTEEIARYLHIWVVLLMLGPLIWTGGHITMDLVLQKMKGPGRKLVRIFGELCTTALALYTFFYSTIYVGKLMKTGVRTFSSKFEMWMPTMGVPIGFFFGALFCIALLVREIAEFRKEDEEGKSLEAEIQDILTTNNLVVDEAANIADETDTKKE